MQAFLRPADHLVYIPAVLPSLWDVSAASLIDPRTVLVFTASNFCRPFTK